MKDSSPNTKRWCLYSTDGCWAPTAATETGLDTKTKVRRGTKSFLLLTLATSGFGGSIGPKGRRYSRVPAPSSEERLGDVPGEFYGEGEPTCPLLLCLRKRGRPSLKCSVDRRHRSQPAPLSCPECLSLGDSAVPRGSSREADWTKALPLALTQLGLAHSTLAQRKRRQPACACAQRAARSRRGGAGGLARAAASATADGSGPARRAYGAPGQGCRHLSRGRRVGVRGRRSAEAGAVQAPGE